MGVRTMRCLFVAPVVLAIIGCTGPKNPSAATAKGTPAAVPPPAIRYDQHIAVEGMQPAGAELTNPFAGDATSADVGRKLFRQIRQRRIQLGQLSLAGHQRCGDHRKNHEQPRDAKGLM